MLTIKKYTCTQNIFKRAVSADFSVYSTLMKLVLANFCFANLQINNGEHKPSFRLISGKYAARVLNINQKHKKVNFDLVTSPFYVVSFKYRENNM